MPSANFWLSFFLFSLLLSYLPLSSFFGGLNFSACLLKTVQWQCLISLWWQTGQKSRGNFPCWLNSKSGFQQTKVSLETSFSLFTLLFLCENVVCCLLNDRFNFAVLLPLPFELFRLTFWKAKFYLAVVVIFNQCCFYCQNESVKKKNFLMQAY